MPSNNAFHWLCIANIADNKLNNIFSRMIRDERSKPILLVFISRKHSNLCWIIVVENTKKNSLTNTSCSTSNKNIFIIYIIHNLRILWIKSDAGRNILEIFSCNAWMNWKRKYLFCNFLSNRKIPFFISKFCKMWI